MDTYLSHGLDGFGIQSSCYTHDYRSTDIVRTICTNLEKIYLAVSPTDNPEVKIHVGFISVSASRRMEKMARDVGGAELVDEPRRLVATAAAASLPPPPGRLALLAASSSFLPPPPPHRRRLLLAAAVSSSPPPPPPRRLVLLAVAASSLPPRPCRLVFPAAYRSHHRTSSSPPRLRAATASSSPPPPPRRSLLLAATSSSPPPRPPRRHLVLLAPPPLPRSPPRRLLAATPTYRCFSTPSPAWGPAHPGQGTPSFVSHGRPPSTVCVCVHVKPHGIHGSTVHVTSFAFTASQWGGWRMGYGIGYYAR